MSRKDAVQITKALVLLKQKRKQDLIKNWQICDPSFLFSLVSVISVWSNFFTTIFGYIESEIWPWLFKSSGRKNVLRKLLRILYRRLKAGFSVC